MTKTYKCSWHKYQSNCENDATILMISTVKKSKGITPIHRIICEDCYNQSFLFYNCSYKSDLPVSAIDDIENILSVLED